MMMKQDEDDDNDNNRLMNQYDDKDYNDIS